MGQINSDNPEIKLQVISNATKVDDLNDPITKLILSISSLSVAESSCCISSYKENLTVQITGSIKFKL